MDSGSKLSNLISRRLSEFRRLSSTLALSIVFLLLISLVCSEVRASEFEVTKQKKCTLLVSPSTDFSVNESFRAETSSGSKIKLKVVKKNRKSDVLLMSGRNGRCAAVRGTLVVQGSSSGGGSRSNKKLYFGISANGGLFTFKQPFNPVANQSTEPTADGAATDAGSAQSPQIINGLAGLGFSGGALVRFVPKSPLGIELGVNALSANVSGKTVIGNNDDYVVTAKFTEVVIVPGLAFSKCITSRLYCRFSGMFAIPLSAKMAVKSTDLAEETAIKYTRMGGDASAGVNLGTAVTLVAGGQISVIKGTFQFPSATEPQQLQNPLTVYIYGGISTAF